MTIEAEALRAILKQHIKVDATGLSPAIASAFVTGFDETVEAIRSVLAEETARAVEDMRERAAEIARYEAEKARMAMSGACDGASYLKTKNEVASSIAAAIRTLPLTPEAPNADR